MAFLNKFLKSKAKDKEAVRKEKKEKAVEKIAVVKTAGIDKKGNYTYGVLLAPHVTEKSTTGNALNKYVFRVANTANKPEIKKAVEGKYGVVVLSVNILNTKPKAVRLGRTEGIRPGYKKAIVTLIQGDKIEVSV